MAFGSETPSDGASLNYGNFAKLQVTVSGCDAPGIVAITEWKINGVSLLGHCGFVDGYTIRSTESQLGDAGFIVPLPVGSYSWYCQVAVMVLGTPTLWTSSTYTFDIVNAPPGRATNPRPADDEEKVSKELIKLEWDAP